MQPAETPDKATFGFNAFDLAARFIRENEAEPSRPEDFGEYRFLGDSPIGSGTLGDVWLAEEQGATRNVAVKILRRVQQSELAGNEIKSQGKLEHKYIARLYNYGVLADGTAWIAMEYVSGQPLDEYCRAHRCTIDQRLRLVRDVAEAVRHAHNEKIDHGDLKPSNILVKENGEPKLLDFGLARRLQNTDDSVAQAVSVFGFTPAYAAPEQFRGESAGFRGDVYALGVILYELLTGHLPFDVSRHTYAEIENWKLTAQKPEPPSVVARRQSIGNHTQNVDPAQWRDLDALCLKGMENDISKRYASVESFMHDLDRYLSDQPLLAREPHTRAYRFHKFLRRNRTPISAVVLMTLVIAALIVSFAVRVTGERNKALAEAARTRRIQRFMLDLFQNGDPQAAPSKDLTVVAALDRGAASAVSLASDPETQTELYRTLGMLFEQLNKFPRADELLRLSLEKSKALGPGNPQTIESLVQLGLLRGDQTSFKEGEQFIQQALDLAARSHPAPGDPQTLNAQSGMGKILAQSGAFDKGIPLLETLVRRPANNPEERVMLSDNLNALAFAYQNTGHYKDAEAVNRRALELDRTVHGDSHPKVAYDIFNIASINAVLGQYPQAEALFRNAAGILEHWYGQDHPETVQIQATVALMAMQNGEDAEAERLLKNVLPLQERIYGTNIQPAIAFTYDSLSKLALKRGRLSEAESDARQGAEINRKLFGEQDYRTAITVGNVASVLLKEGQFQEAEVIVRPAINALMAHPFPGNMSVGVTQITLGEALLGQKRYSEAILPLEAGYEMLKQKPGAFAAKLQDVRKDLAQIYDLLKQPEKAAKLHAEISRVKR